MIEGEEKSRFNAEDIFNVLLVGTFPSCTDTKECLEHLNELKLLACSCGLVCVEFFLVPIKKFNAAIYIGSGKVDEIFELVNSCNIDAVIFDDEITPNQQRNLEKIIQRPVFDRTELIIEVFARRALTREASLQVELARIKYQLPRLKRMWTHLSRQRIGGKASSTMRGEGEKQIEVDKRILKRRIDVLEKDIRQVHNRRDVQRQSRVRSGIPTFAIVGYTNAGKSTLMNALTDSGVLVEDQLFATLDTTTRKYKLMNNQEVLLIDTVGFIRKLPHTLVAAFKGTLEEVCYTDVILHLIDASSKNAMEHALITEELLKELGTAGKPKVTVLNKIDACESTSLTELSSHGFENVVKISALNGSGIDSLLNKMIESISNLRIVVNLRVPQSEYGTVSKMIESGKVLVLDYDGNDVLVKIDIPANLEHKIRCYATEEP